jgi:hypothetical protein
MKQWLLPAAVGVGLFAASAAVFAGSLWLITEFVDDREVRLATAFVFGLAFLLSIIAAIVAAFHAMELTSPTSAFGLPEGSIRAIIALILVLIFVLMSIYLVQAVFLEKTASDEARNAATQILATVGTLVAAVAAFYFGSAAVTAGTRAASSAVEAARGPMRPSAITKGSRAVPGGGYELVGVVNTRGLATQYYFEYGPDQSYGNRTTLASAGSANVDQEVNSGLLSDVETGWHLRFVAFNDAGTSYGADATTDPPSSEPAESTPSPSAGPSASASSTKPQPDADSGASQATSGADRQTEPETNATASTEGEQGAE